MSSSCDSYNYIHVHVHTLWRFVNCGTSNDRKLLGASCPWVWSVPKSKQLFCKQQCPESTLSLHAAITSVTHPGRNKFATKHLGCRQLPEQWQCRCNTHKMHSYTTVLLTCIPIELPKQKCPTTGQMCNILWWHTFVTTCTVLYDSVSCEFDTHLAAEISRSQTLSDGRRHVSCCYKHP